MKSIIYKSFTLLAIVLLSTFLLPSCGKDPHDDMELSGDISDLVPSYSVYLSCTYSISNKTIHIDAEPKIYLELDKWGLHIDHVDYYVDDVYCETITKAPYHFTYKSQDWTAGAHTVRADLWISGENIETMILPCTRVLNNTSAGSKAADIYFDYNYVTTGDEFSLSVCFNPDRSEPGTRIISANASWDGTSIGEKTSAPYTFTKQITDAVGTTHQLAASVSYEQGNSRSTISFSSSSYEVCGPTSVRQSYSICSRYRDFENGETLKGKAKLFKGKDVKTNYGLEIYLDDVLIAETRDFPYVHEYLLSGLAAGEHKLKETWVRYDANWSKLSDMSLDETINITK